jgi:hypothetical protein
MVGTRRGSGHSDPPRSEEHPPGPDEGLDCHHPTPGRRPPARPPDLWSIASRAQNSPVLIMIGKTCEGIALSEPVSRESLDRRPVLVPWIIRITPSTIGLDSTRCSRSRSRPRLEVPRPNHGLTTRGHLLVTPSTSFVVVGRLLASLGTRSSDLKLGTSATSVAPRLGAYPHAPVRPAIVCVLRIGIASIHGRSF